MLPQDILAQPLMLAHGGIIRNRLAKAAMSESLGTFNNHATLKLEKLYGRFALGGIGLCITGNVMIDRRALGEPHNVVLEDEADVDILRAWAKAGTQNGTQLWMQLNHPGKQAPRGLNKETVSPSAVPFRAGMTRYFATPRELLPQEIEDIIERFGAAARIAQKTGFSGVQIHGAHGYLVSQFLSPHHNRRTDKWGGNAKNRSKFVLEVLAEMRRQVGPQFAIGIKLNSADFQRGGFSEQESLHVIFSLAQAGIDLVEISGGTYEAPAMMGGKQKESTLRREAYFIEFAEKARATVRVPLMLTGGFRTLEGMAQAIASGAVDMVGLARPLAVEPSLPTSLLTGKSAIHPIKPITTGIAMFDRMGLTELGWYTRQLHRMGQGKDPKPHDSAVGALFKNLVEGGWRMFNTRLRG